VDIQAFGIDAVPVMEQQYLGGNRARLRVVIKEFDHGAQPSGGDFGIDVEWGDIVSGGVGEAGIDAAGIAGVPVAGDEGEGREFFTGVFQAAIAGAIIDEDDFCIGVVLFQYG